MSLVNSGTGASLLAIRVAARPATQRRTFGYYRLEILAAVFNGVLLFAIAGYVPLEATRRLEAPPEVASAAMLGVAVIGLGANLFSAWLATQRPSATAQPARRVHRGAAASGQG